ncbi:hypothetical protein PAXRUDRAFT_16662 [Paxillus rubicundulus Ve08.2h10]|uniref:Uncharacterized protein n=1 Tax=Paxillus rubicundulus Ve08.2h10 TaxID=930991 RepID=A0A0D0DKS4_9AGAM|nr:hypothetical protein PAXRUDRAFT_16662 [Paxillus rubicundulus Ve08.2h10]
MNCLRLKEEEAAHEEERKKNHNKFLPLNNVKVTSTVPITPSPHALHKLQKGKYVKLHYFTNKGLAKAQSISHSVDNDALTLMQDKQNTLVCPNCCDEATHCLLQAMKECGWEDDCVNAHLHFWMNLSAHEWQHDAKDTARQALILYQAMY